MRDTMQTMLELTSRVKTLPQSMAVLAGSREIDKTRLAKMLFEKGLASYINLSLVLSRYLMTVNSLDDVGWRLDFTAHLLSHGSVQPFILDHIEAVFEPALRLHPLSWFLQIARDVPLIVVWPRVVLQGEFIYSIPNRPDYFHQRDPSIPVVHIDA